MLHVCWFRLLKCEDLLHYFVDFEESLGFGPIMFVSVIIQSLSPTRQAHLVITGCILLRLIPN